MQLLSLVNESSPSNQSVPLPGGTQIVSRIEILDDSGQLLCPRGAAGVITQPLPQPHTYRVLFQNGVEASLRRDELSLRQSPAAVSTRDEGAWYEFVIYRCEVGLRAYGLAHEQTEAERRGIYLPPAALHWSLAGVPEQLENPETGECYWELQKFLRLALKANPNILECLYTPHIEYATELARELLELREVFLSQLVYQTYSGYALAQFRKLEQAWRAHGAPDWEDAMHLLRLLYAGIGILRDGQLTVRAGAQRDELLAIRQGALSWEEFNQLRLKLHGDFDGALNFTRLPEQPDYTSANAFLLKARRAQVVED